MTEEEQHQLWLLVEATAWRTTADFCAIQLRSLLPERSSTQGAELHALLRQQFDQMTTAMLQHLPPDPNQELSAMRRALLQDALQEKADWLLQALSK